MKRHYNYCASGLTGSTNFSYNNLTIPVKKTVPKTQRPTISLTTDTIKKVAPPPPSNPVYNGFYQKPAIRKIPPSVPEYYPVRAAAAAAAAPRPIIDDFHPVRPRDGVPISKMTENELLWVAMRNSEESLTDDEIRREKKYGHRSRKDVDDEDMDTGEMGGFDDDDDFAQPPDTDFVVHSTNFRKTQKPFSTVAVRNTSSSSSLAAPESTNLKDKWHIITIAPTDSRLEKNRVLVFVLYMKNLKREDVYDCMSNVIEHYTEDKKAVDLIYYVDSLVEYDSSNLSYRKSMSNTAYSNTIQKNVFFDEWEYYDSFQSTLFRYTKGKQKVLINDIIKSTARLIDPDTENNIPFYLEQFFTKEEKSYSPSTSDIEKDLADLEVAVPSTHDFPGYPDEKPVEVSTTSNTTSTL